MQGVGATNENAAGCNRRRLPSSSHNDCTEQAASVRTDLERLLDGVTMCRSVSLFAMRGWFDVAVDLGVARADGHKWDTEQAMRNAVERLRETLHAAIDAAADLKLTAGAQGRIQ